MDTEYNDHEWRAMLYAPLWVFGVVAGVDGQVDEEGWDALFEALLAACKYRNDLSREVFSQLIEEFDEIVAAFEEDETDVEEDLGRVADLLNEREDEEVASGFKADVIMITTEAAMACSGWLSGSGISDEERQAIDYISTALRISDEDFYAILEDLEIL